MLAMPKQPAYSSNDRDPLAPRMHRHRAVTDPVPPAAALTRAGGDASLPGLLP